MMDGAKRNRVQLVTRDSCLGQEGGGGNRSAATGGEADDAAGGLERRSWWSSGVREEGNKAEKEREVVAGGAWDWSTREEQFGWILQWQRGNLRPPKLCGQDGPAYGGAYYPKPEPEKSEPKPTEPEKPDHYFG
jgi:hypothetical protein